MNTLPNEVIHEILGYLDYKDLISCSLVNKKLNILTKHESFWKKMCKKYWLQNKCPRNRTWKMLFVSWYLDMGKYIEHYGAIKSAWDKMIAYLQSHNCPVYKTIQGGVTEVQLDKLERLVGHKLPKDFRCSYRIHNGQRNTYTGLFGTCYHYQSSQRLLDIKTICELVENMLKTHEHTPGYIPLTFYSWYSSRGHIGQYLTICHCDGYDKDTVFHLAYKINKQDDDAFITGNSFKEWITSYADHLSSNRVHLERRKITRFRIDPVYKKTVGYLRIMAMISFQSEISQIKPPSFEFSYRFVFTLAEDAPESETCILKSSIWITDNGDRKEYFRVQSHREQIELKPGCSVTWACTALLHSTHGSVTGIAHFQNIATEEINVVECPVVPLNCLPFITADQRRAKRKVSKPKHNA